MNKYVICKTILISPSTFQNFITSCQTIHLHTLTIGSQAKTTNKWFITYICDGMRTLYFQRKERMIMNENKHHSSLAHKRVFHKISSLLYNK